MAKEQHIYQYATYNDWEDADQNGKMNIPNASYVESDDAIHGFTRAQLKQMYFGTRLLEDGTVTLTIGSYVNGNNNMTSISYAVGQDKDLGNWTTTSCTSSAQTITVTATAGTTIWWKGTGTRTWARTNQAIPDGGCIFTANVPFSVMGNILSLFYGDNDFPSKTDMGSIGGLFYQSTNLVDAGNLLLGTPKNGVGSYHLRDLFNGCTSLESAPMWWSKDITLTFDCGNSIFANCTSLKNLQKIKLTIGAGSFCSNMFYNCTSLEDASMMTVGCSNATSSWNNMFKQMFKNCVNLKKLPTFTTIPTENATSNGCFYETFYGCASLEDVILNGVVKSTSADSGGGNYFRDLCNGCTSLKVLRALWVANIPMHRIAKDVAEYGKFYKHGGARWANTSITDFPYKWDIVWIDGIDMSDDGGTLEVASTNDTFTFTVYGYPAVTASIDNSLQKHLFLKDVAYEGGNINKVTVQLNPIDLLSSIQVPVSITNAVGSKTVNIAIIPTVNTYDSQVEYIENTGSSWINVGYYPSGDDVKIEGKFYPTSYSYNNAAWFTNYKDGNTNFFGMSINSNNNKQIVSVNASKNGGTASVTGVNALCEFSLTKGQVIMNGNTVTYTPTVATDYSDNPIYIFYRYLSSTHLYTRGRVYYFKIYKNNTLVVDLIPVRKSGVGYLYDTITGTLLPNRGDGEFIYGDDVVSE